MATDAIEWRMRQVERRQDDITKRVSDLDEHGTRRVGVIEAVQQQQGEDIRELKEAVKSLRNTIIGAAVSVAVAMVGSSLLLYATIGGGAS